MARIFFFTGFSVFPRAVGETTRLLAAKENLTIKEFPNVGNAKRGCEHARLGIGITQRRTAYSYPVVNSCIERFHRSLKEEESLDSGVPQSERGAGFHEALY
jgi:hypothetical protein